MFAKRQRKVQNNKTQNSTLNCFDCQALIDLRGHSGQSRMFFTGNSVYVAPASNHDTASVRVDYRQNVVVDFGGRGVTGTGTGKE